MFPAVERKHLHLGCREASDFAVAGGERRLHHIHLARVGHAGLDEGGKQRVRLPDGRFVLGVELHTDEPALLRQLEDLDEVPLQVNADESHPVLVEFVPEHVVDLEPVPMPFLHLCLAVDIPYA